MSIYRNECYIIDNNSSWFHMNMIKKRIYSASIAIGNKLWVVGGEGDLNSNSTSEYISLFTNNSAEPGPDLPRPFHSHALVSLNKTTFMLIGKYLLHKLKSKIAVSNHFCTVSITGRKRPALVDPVHNLQLGN